MKILTLTKTAEYLGIHKRKFYRMIADGSFPVKPIKGTRPRLWNIEHVEKWRQENAQN